MRVDPIDEYKVFGNYKANSKEGKIAYRIQQELALKTQLYLGSKNFIRDLVGVGSYIRSVIVCLIIWSRYPQSPLYVYPLAYYAFTILYGLYAQSRIHEYIDRELVCLYL